MRRHRILLPVSLVFVLALSAGMANAEALRLRVLHVNDFHGFAEPTAPAGSTDLRGGAAALAGAVERLRSERPGATLLLAAGDMIQGHPWTNLVKGRSTIAWMNLLRFDAMVLGNHEFDFGMAILRERAREARFPFLAANVRGLGNSIRPDVVLNAGAVRVALLGLVTEETPQATHPANVKGLAFLSPEAVCRERVENLRRRADVVIALTHLGHPEDVRLARQCPGIDLIIGGHSHTRIEQPQRENGVLIAQAWEHGKAVGVVDITVEQSRIKTMTGRLHEIRPALEAPDPEAAQLVAGYARMMEKQFDAVVGTLAVDLAVEDVRWREAPFGNYVADAMARAGGASIALVNGGSLRTGLPRGDVRQRDLYRALPFDGYLVRMTLPGRSLRQALEHAVERVEIRAGAFLQVSGLMFVYDRSAPPGKRLREVQVNGKPLTEAQDYTVVVTDFMAAGGDGYGFLATAAGDRQVRGMPLRQAVADAVRAGVPAGPAGGQNEGRIRTIEKD